MSPVFRHGRLRLYLLKLLDEAPRHGYEVIRLLQDRFLGVYSPSPGTIYPRLARLEEEGLVTHDEVDGKKVYRITEKGRDEIRGRLDDLAELEDELAASVRDIAREITQDVRDTVRSLREELTRTARDIRGRPADEAGEHSPAAEQETGPGARREPGPGGRREAGAGAWREASAGAWAEASAGSQPAAGGPPREAGAGQQQEPGAGQQQEPGGGPQQARGGPQQAGPGSSGAGAGNVDRPQRAEERLRQARDEAMRLREEARHTREHMREAFRSQRSEGRRPWGDWQNWAAGLQERPPRPGAAAGPGAGPPRPGAPARPGAPPRSRAAGPGQDGGPLSEFQRLVTGFARELQAAAGHAESVGGTAAADLRGILEDALTRIRNEIFGAAGSRPGPEAADPRPAAQGQDHSDSAGG